MDNAITPLRVGIHVTCSRKETFKSRFICFPFNSCNEIDIVHWIYISGYFTLLCSDQIICVYQLVMIYFYLFSVFHFQIAQGFLPKFQTKIDTPVNTINGSKCYTKNALGYSMLSYIDRLSCNNSIVITNIDIKNLSTRWRRCVLTWYDIVTITPDSNSWYSNYCSYPITHVTV